MECVICTTEGLDRVRHHQTMKEAGRPYHISRIFTNLLEQYRLYLPWKNCTSPSVRFAHGVRLLRYATARDCTLFIAFLAIYDSYLSFHEYADRENHVDFCETLIDIQQIAQRVIDENDDPIVTDYAKGTLARMVFAFKCGRPMMSRSVA